MSAKLKILCVLGTKTEGIKLAPVVRCLRARSDRFDTHVCSTGQHRTMLDQVLRLFSIRVDTDLRIMSHDQSPASAAGLILPVPRPAHRRIQTRLDVGPGRHDERRGGLSRRLLSPGEGGPRRSRSPPTTAGSPSPRRPTGASPRSWLNAILPRPRKLDPTCFVRARLRIKLSSPETR